MRQVTSLLISALTGTAFAAGPKIPAHIEIGLWPKPLQSPADFDTFSRGNILVFQETIEKFASADLSEITGLKTPDRKGTQAWSNSMLDVLADNMKLARQSCTEGLPFCGAGNASAQLESKSLSPDLINWVREARSFYGMYAKEQLRLAALFYKTTSEIFLHNEGELDGLRMADRSFSLTFDDGPTGKNKQTDKTIAMLNGLGLTGHFFVLGENLAWRNERTKDVAELYKGHCMANHGFQHNSHAKKWEDSIARTHSLLTTHFGKSDYPFRPPYGQRLPDLTAALAKDNRSVVLWNLDSQDWHQRLTAKNISGRMVHLMGAWRRGILLFHDIHDRSITALPEIHTFFAKSGINWLPCKDGFGDKVRNFAVRKYPAKPQ